MHEGYRKHLESLDLDVLVKRICLIGLGGIGSHLLRALIIFLRSVSSKQLELMLCDGDEFEANNEYRMQYQKTGNKALVLASEILAKPIAHLTVRPFMSFVKPDNINDVVTEGSCVFLCVDNHATRKLVSDHCETLDSVVLISGGNDGANDESKGTHGNIQLFVRKNGENITAPLTKFHGEIAQPEDEAPEDLDCLEAAEEGAVQLIFANLTAATCMLNAFYRLLLKDGPHFDEAYFDIVENKTVAIYLTN